MSGLPPGQILDRLLALDPLICHINLERGFRGGERQTELLIRELAASGLRQALVTAQGGELARRLADLPGLDLRSCRGLYSASRALAGADLVHVHQGRAVYPAALARLLRHQPYLVTRRVPNPPGSGPLTRRAYLAASKMVAISRAVAQSLAEAFGVAPGGVAIIPSAFAACPADPARARELRQQWGGEFVVGNVAALDHSHKGQADLIAVARRLARSHPEVQFVLVGSGRDEARFRQQCEGLANVHFAGFQQRVGDYLAAFDLFAFPSLKEGMGSTLLDAMDHGLAVVASNVGGIPEVVVDGETGVLVPPGDAQRLGDAILALLDDPPRRRAMGEAGRQRSRLFSARAMAQAYVGVYLELLEGGSGGAPMGYHGMPGEHAGAGSGPARGGK